VQVIFEVPFSFKLDTYLLAVNLMDKFASKQGESVVTAAATHLLGLFGIGEDEYNLATAAWRMGIAVDDATQWRSLLLVAGIALTVASKYEENQIHHVGMAVVRHLFGIHNLTRAIKSQLAKAESVFLQVIDWDLGLPGPLPFLRHLIFGLKWKYGGNSEDASEEALVELVAGSCIRIAMTHNDFIWHSPRVVAHICHELASCVIQSAKLNGYKRLITDHHVRMRCMASELKLNAWEVRRGMSTILLHILKGPFFDQRFCWWERLPHIRYLIYWLWSEESLYRQQSSASLRYSTY
jgi:hypothetical protein